jgi:hypothetical protein
MAARQKAANDTSKILDWQEIAGQLLRVHDLSGSVARHLSGCHIALKGVRDDAEASATGDTEDEIRRGV